MTDWAQFAELWGLPGVVILGLAWAWKRERDRGEQHVEARIADQKAHTAEILEMMRSIDRALDALQAAQRHGGDK